MDGYCENNGTRLETGVARGFYYARVRYSDYDSLPGIEVIEHFSDDDEGPVKPQAFKLIRREQIPSVNTKGWPVLVARCDAHGTAECSIPDCPATRLNHHCYSN